MEKYLEYVIIVLIIFIILYMHSRSIESSNLVGFWQATTEYCTSAELQSCTFYIAPNMKDGYMIMENASGLIVNNPIELSIGSAFVITPFISYCKTHNLYIDWLNDQPEFLPDTFSMSVYPSLNKLVLYSDDNLYGVFYKNCEMTNAV